MLSSQLLPIVLDEPVVLNLLGNVVVDVLVELVYFNVVFVVVGFLDVIVPFFFVEVVVENVVC